MDNHFDSKAVFSREDIKMLAFLGGLISLTAISTDISLPAIPELAEKFQVDVSSTHAIVSLFLLGYGLMQPLYGPLSDRLGRKPVLIFGLSVFFVTSIACTIATSAESLYIARFIQGMGAGSGPVLARAILRDVYSGKKAERALALTMFAMAFGPIIAPVLGGVITEFYGVMMVFIALSVLALIYLLLSGLWFSESLLEKRENTRGVSGIIAGYKNVYQHPSAKFYMLSGGFSYTTMLCYISASPAILIEGYGVSSQAYGYYFSISAGFILLGALLNSTLLKRADIFGLTCIGALFSCFGGLSMFVLAYIFPGMPMGVVMPAALVAFGLAIVLPNSTASAMHPFAQRAGAASAAIGSTQIVLGVVTGYVVGRFYDGSVFPMALGISIAGIASLFFLLIAKRTDKQDVDAFSSGSRGK